MTESDYDGIIMKATPEFIKYMQKYFPSACWIFKNKQSDKAWKTKKQIRWIKKTGGETWA